MKTILSLLLTALFIVFSNSSVLACAACYGDTSGSKQGTAAAAGIGVMVVIVFGMLGTLAVSGYRLAQRAKNPLPDYDELLSDETDDTEPKS